MHRLLALMLSAFLILGSISSARADTGPSELLKMAEVTLTELMSNQEFKELHDEFKTAKAVLIVPRMLKGGFVIGGEYGDGVLLVRRDDNTWSDPAFYRTGSGSVGFQIGLQDSQQIVVIRSEKALQAILQDQFKMGADVDLTAGYYGKGMGGGMTTALGADILTFSKGRGAFGGGAVEGTVYAKRNDWNSSIYGDTYSPQAIVSNFAGKYQEASVLRGLLASYY